MIANGGGGKGAAVRLTRLEKSYDGHAAVRGVTLEVEAGEFFTLLGPSGSGKTTVLMSIAGFIPLTGGTIRIGGAEVTHLPPYRRSVGMVFQSYALFPHMTVAENIGFPLRMRHVPRARIRDRVDWALRLIRLDGYDGRYPRQLSGGQQQRVALARALVFEPSVLLMDEPLGALDRKLRAEIQLELVKIHDALGLTVIYVTHDQEEALTMSDRIAVMNGGRVVQVGTPEELYERPAERFVSDFLGETNALDAVIDGVHDEAVTVRTASGARLQAAPDGRLADGEPVTLCIRPERILLGEAAAGLENVLEGQLRKVVYLGEASKCFVDLPGGATLTVKLQNQAGVRRLEEGRPVVVGFHRDSARLFRREVA